MSGRKIIRGLKQAIEHAKATRPRFGVEAGYFDDHMPNTVIPMRRGPPHTFGYQRIHTYPDGSILWEAPNGNRVHFPDGQIIIMPILPTYRDLEEPK